MCGSARSMSWGADPRRGLRARGTGDPARARSPRRRADPGPHHARAAQGSDAGAARSSASGLSADGLSRDLRVRGGCPAPAGGVAAPADARRHPAGSAAGARAPAGLAAGRRYSRASSGIALDQPASVNDADARGWIADAEPRGVCVCAFGALIKEPLLSEHLMLNVHPSLLPRWRGAAPIERAIMAGDEQTGVSIMRVTAGLDSGPVCAQRSEPISPQDTYGTLAPRLADLGGELLIAVLDRAATVRGAGRRPGHLRREDLRCRPRARPGAVRHPGSSASCALSRRTSAPT